MSCAFGFSIISVFIYLFLYSVQGLPILFLQLLSYTIYPILMLLIPRKLTWLKSVLFTIIWFLRQPNFSLSSCKILEGIRLISLNTRGISNFQKGRKGIYLVSEKRADAIFLHETHSKKEIELQWCNEWGTKMILSHGSPNARGVAILLNKGVDYCIQSKIIDPLGRFVIVKVEIEHNLYLLINVYAPNKDNENVNFFNDLLAIIRREDLDAEESFIVGGDFNCPLNPVLNKKGGSLTPRKSVVTSGDCC